MTLSNKSLKIMTKLVEGEKVTNKEYLYCFDECIYHLKVYNDFFYLDKFGLVLKKNKEMTEKKRVKILNEVYKLCFVDKKVTKEELKNIGKKVKLLINEIPEGFEKESCLYFLEDLRKLYYRA